MAVTGITSKNSRKDIRKSEPVLTIAFDGKRYETLDWGFGGFKLKRYEGKLKREDEIIVTHLALPSGTGIAARAKALVLRNNTVKKELSCTFEGLDDNIFDFIEKVSLRRLK